MNAKAERMKKGDHAMSVARETLFCQQRCRLEWCSVHRNKRELCVTELRILPCTPEVVDGIRQLLKL